MSKSLVSVIIINWNGGEVFKNCLQSLSKIDYQNWELIVVDNGSGDGSVEAVTKEFPEVDLLQTGANLGFTGGYNRGLEYAMAWGADYFLVINNDTLLGSPDILQKLIETAESDPEAGLVVPKIYFAKGYEFHKNRYQPQELGKVIWYAGGDIDWNNVYGSNHGVDEVDKGQFDEVRETDFATGCLVMYKAKALKEVGLYDKKFFAYMEDADHAQRIKRAGWKILYSPKGWLWHKVSQSSGIGSELNDYFLTRNRMIFGMRYASLRTKFALLRESIKLLLSGRKWQKIGIKDYYLGNLGKGSWGKK